MTETSLGPCGCCGPTAPCSKVGPFPCGGAYPLTAALAVAISWSTVLTDVDENNCPGTCAELEGEAEYEVDLVRKDGPIPFSSGEAANAPYHYTTPDGYTGPVSVTFSAHCRNGQFYRFGGVEVVRPDSHTIAQSAGPPGTWCAVKVTPPGQANRYFGCLPSLVFQAPNYSGASGPETLSYTTYDTFGCDEAGAGAWSTGTSHVREVRYYHPFPSIEYVGHGTHSQTIDCVMVIG